MFGQLFFVFLLLVFAVLAFKSFVTIKDGEYVVVYRLGKLVRWHGPGAIIIIPFIERVVRIPLHLIVGWQTMRQEELEKYVIVIAMKMKLEMPID
jgi:regulator of protease activity HflC (stomatin/prohibitin superfamily)